MHTITSLDKKLAFGQFHRGGPARVDISSAKSHHDNQTYQLACITKLGTFWYFCVFLGSIWSHALPNCDVRAKNTPVGRSSRIASTIHTSVRRGAKNARNVIAKYFPRCINYGRISKLPSHTAKNFAKGYPRGKTSYPFLLLEEVDPVPNAKVGIPGMAVRIRSDCGVHVEREHWPTNNIWAHFTSRLHGHR